MPSALSHVPPHKAQQEDDAQQAAEASAAAQGDGSDNGNRGAHGETGAGGDDRRDRRSRDRYGRDRRERGERGPREEAAADTPVQTAMFDENQAAPHVKPMQNAPEKVAISAPAVAATSAPVAAAAPATGGLPRVTPFELPVPQLVAVAQGSGLQWVNSDAEKIAAAQAAMAAEPKPVHVPRERPPAVTLDDGPLILVETRRDLREMTLPFENTPAA
jgi:ribonuclease E